jgi:hypothetical protein
VEKIQKHRVYRERYQGFTVKHFPLHFLRPVRRDPLA